jgi:hypothetical protein
MAITQGLCSNSFKKELLEGVHNFTVAGDTIKIALYTDAANLDSTTTAYTASGEVSDAGTNYTAGGETLTKVRRNVGFSNFYGSGCAYLQLDPSKQSHNGFGLWCK